MVGEEGKLAIFGKKEKVEMVQYPSIFSTEMTGKVGAGGGGG